MQTRPGATRVGTYLVTALLTDPKTVQVRMVIRDGNAKSLQPLGVGRLG
jgi:hypothetical protein